jgi:peptidyl-dipeptidase A
MNQDPRKFVEKTTEQVRPLEKAYLLAEWEAAVTGSEEAIEQDREAQAAFMRFWSDPQLFQATRQLHEAGRAGDPLLSRQLELIYLCSARNQQDEATIRRLTELESRVRQRYYNCRARVDGRELSDNQIDEMLKASQDSKQVQQVWQASKQVGQQVAADVRELARLDRAGDRGIIEPPLFRGELRRLPSDRISVS